MPYSPRYIMQQMARGRPMPSGSPEDDLFNAIQRVSAMDMDKAFHSGATSQSRVRGQNPFHALLDRCINPRDCSLSVDPRRALECVRALVRGQVRMDELDHKTNETVATRLSLLATPQLGPELIRLISPRVLWGASSGIQGKTVADVWSDRVSPDVSSFIPSPSPRPRVR